MKKILLASSALLAATSLSAQDPQLFPQAQFVGMSPDKQFAVSEIDGTLMFFDLESGEDPRIFAESATGDVSYTVGNGNFMGDNILTAYRGSLGGASVYIWGAGGILNGRWYTLPGGTNRANLGTPNAVTADGSRICGNSATGEEFGIEAEGSWVIPCYWDKEGNVISSKQSLPYPDKDFAGLAPQYITAVAISDDGRTIVGQSRSNDGFFVEVIVYVQAEDGSWSYYKPFESLVNPENIQLPPYPGESPTIPSQETYMTAEELDAYTAAFQEYVNNPGSKAPEYEDFMTAEEIAAYRQALVDVTEWEAKYLAWVEDANKIKDTSVSFEYNQVAISPNGRYLGVTAKTAVEMDENYVEYATYVPYLYDLQERKIVLNEGPNVLITGVSDNGAILAQQLAGDVNFGYILPAGKTEWVALQDYILSRRPELKDWIDENWYHSVQTEFIDEDGEVDYRYEDMYITGIPFASRDFTTFYSTAYAFWTGAPSSYSGNYVSYVIPVGEEEVDSIAEVAAAAPAATGVTYDLQGRCVASPGHGFYIRDGKKIIL